MIDEDLMQKARDAVANLSGKQMAREIRGGLHDDITAVRACYTALQEERDGNNPAGKYKIGDRVTKPKGSSWTGRVCGFYSTKLTPVGYNVESENEPGSVQLYPEAALAAAPQPATAKEEG